MPTRPTNAAVLLVCLCLSLPDAALGQSPYPDVRSERVADATRILVSAGYDSIELVRGVAQDVPPDVVIWQDPEPRPGFNSPRTTRVRLLVWGTLEPPPVDTVLIVRVDTVRTVTVDPVIVVVTDTITTTVTISEVSTPLAIALTAAGVILGLVGCRTGIGFRSSRLRRPMEVSPSTPSESGERSPARGPRIPEFSALVRDEAIWVSRGQPTDRGVEQQP